MSNDDFDDDFPEMDVGDVDPSKIGSHIAVDKPGKYHFGINEVRVQLQRTKDNGNPRYPDILIVCEVLESVPGQSGKGALYFHSLIVAGKGGAAPEDWIKGAFSNFLCGIGVLVKKDGQIIDPTTGTAQVNMRTLAERIQAVQQFVGELKVNKSDDPQYDDKVELMFGRGAFQVDDPAVASVPKCVAALKLIGKESAAAGVAAAAPATGKGAGKGTGNGAAKKESAASAANSAPSTPAPEPSAAAVGGLDTSDL